jgi:hypothetical protein
MSSRVAKFVIGGALIAGSFLIPGLGPTVAGLMLSAGSSLAANAIFGSMGQHAGSQSNAPNTMGSLPVVYGKARVWGKCVDCRVDPNSTDRKDLYMVLALCHGSRDGSGITGIDEIYFDDRLAVDASGTVQSPFAGKVTVTKYFGGTSQTRDATLGTKFATEWPSTSAGKGVAYLVVKLTYDKEVFSGGIPTISAIVRGNRVLDPRTSTWAWSANSALAVYDYLQSTIYGVGIPAAELTTADFITEANHCDEDVTTTGGGTADRFTCNGVVDTGQTVGTNLKALLSSCRGWLVYEGGSFRMFIRKVKTATTFVLDETSIIGEMSYTLPGINDAYNRVSGQWINPNNNLYQPDTVDWPRAGTANTFLTDDNSFDVNQTVELPFTTNKYTVEQIIMVLLRESRDSMAVQLVASEAALQLQIGDVVPVSHSTPGWTGKLFWVLASTLMSDGTVRLGLVEYNANAYSLDVQPTLVEAPNGGLPNPFVCAQPGPLSLLSDGTTIVRSADGTPNCGIAVTWTAASDPFLERYELKWRKTGAPTWNFAPDPSSIDTTALIGPIDSYVSIDVDLCAVNTLGIRSAHRTATIQASAGGLGLFGNNLVRNGNGQEGATGTQAPGWTVNSGFIVTPDTVAKFGDRSLRFNNTSGADSSQYQVIGDLLAGQMYVLSGWISCGATTIGTGLGTYMYITNSASADVASSVDMMERIGDPATGVTVSAGVNANAAGFGFTFVQCIFLVKTTITNARLFLQHGRGTLTGQAWFDEIELRPLPKNAYDAYSSNRTLRADVQGRDTVNLRAVMKGLQRPMVYDGQAISFVPAYQSVPAIFMTGGLSTQPDSTQWSIPGSYNNSIRVLDDYSALNLDANGFTVRAKLRQPGVVIERYHGFAAATLNTFPSTGPAVTLSNAPSRDDNYDCRAVVRLGAQVKSGTQTISLTYGVESNAASGAAGSWVERLSGTASDSFVVGDPYTEDTFLVGGNITVSGLDSTDQVRFTVKSQTHAAAFSETNQMEMITTATSSSFGVHYQNAADNITSKTPGGAAEKTIQLWAMTDGLI